MLKNGINHTKESKKHVDSHMVKGGVGHMAKWHIKEFVRRISVENRPHYNTIHTWFKELERNNIHYVARNEQNQRIYRENELEIVLYMLEHRKTFRQMDGLYELVGNECAHLLRKKKKQMITTKEETVELT